jgi:hypothetical protein
MIDELALEAALESTQRYSQPRMSISVAERIKTELSERNEVVTKLLEINRRHEEKLESLQQQLRQEAEHRRRLEQQLNELKSILTNPGLGAPNISHRASVRKISDGKTGFKDEFNELLEDLAKPTPKPVLASASMATTPSNNNNNNNSTTPGSSFSKKSEYGVIVLPYTQNTNQQQPQIQSQTANITNVTTTTTTQSPTTRENNRSNSDGKAFDNWITQMIDSTEAKPKNDIQAFLNSPTSYANALMGNNNNSSNNNNNITNSNQSHSARNLLLSTSRLTKGSNNNNATPRAQTIIMQQHQHPMSFPHHPQQLDGSLLQ